MWIITIISTHLFCLCIWFTWFFALKCNPEYCAAWPPWVWVQPTTFVVKVICLTVAHSIFLLLFGPSIFDFPEGLELLFSEASSDVVSVQVRTLGLSFVLLTVSSLCAESSLGWFYRFLSFMWKGTTFFEKTIIFLVRNQLRAILTTVLCYSPDWAQLPCHMLRPHCQLLKRNYPDSMEYCES